jgi:hypothetical protein
VDSTLASRSKGTLAFNAVLLIAYTFFSWCKIFTIIYFTLYSI